jgi:hypothetical protein
MEIPGAGNCIQIDCWANLVKKTAAGKFRLKPTAIACHPSAKAGGNEINCTRSISLPSHFMGQMDKKNKCAISFSLPSASRRKSLSNMGPGAGCPPDSYRDISHQALGSFCVNPTYAQPADCELQTVKRKRPVFISITGAGNAFK